MVLFLKEEEIESWLFELILRREILGFYEAEVRELARLCKNQSEFSVLKHVLEKVVIVNEAQLQSAIDRMATGIKSQLKDDQKAAIVAMAWDDSPDSSQQLLQRLKVQFHNWKNIKFFNRVPSYVKPKIMEEFSTFILIDDFTGTGKTVLTRMNYVMKAGEGSGIKLDGRINLLFGINEALINIKDSYTSLTCVYSLPKGLSGHFSGAQLAENISHMKRLEEELAANIDGNQLPSLGHGGAEALFCIRNANAPNSNFPILWWPQDAKFEERLPMFRRAGF
ncbi:phosphoribosyltransferase-like protein [Agrobacterium leguminum]